jgi:hypothetical protein
MDNQASDEPEPDKGREPGGPAHVAPPVGRWWPRAFVGRKVSRDQQRICQFFPGPEILDKSG